jgi:transient-receptor-potential-like protein
LSYNKELQEKQRDYRYTSVMRALVWRYVSAMHRQAEENPVTEDDISEVKGEISAAKCELLEVLRSNGMDVSEAQMKEKGKLYVTVCHLNAQYHLYIWDWIFRQ